MSAILLLIVSVFAASINSVLLHLLPAKKDVVTFNMFCSSIWFVLLFSLNGFKIEISPEIVLWGIAYGILQMLFLLFKTLAMSSGSVSATTLIGNCSLILSTAVSVIVWRERISIYQIFGIALLLASVIICTAKNTSGGHTKSWIPYCVFFFVFASGVGIIFKCYSKYCTESTSAVATTSMMAIAAATSAITLLIVKLIRSFKREKITEKAPFNIKYPLIILACGILGCTYNRLNIMLAGILDGSVFYPCFNGGTVLLSLILSIIFLKERLTARQTVGVILGAASVAVIGLF